MGGIEMTQGVQTIIKEFAIGGKGDDKKVGL